MAETATVEPVAPAPDDTTAADAVVIKKATADPVAETPASPEQPSAPPATTTPAAEVKAEAPAPTYALTLPEGSPLDPTYLETLKTQAKTLGLTEQQFPEFVRLRGEEVKAALDADAQGLEEIKADPLLGGANYERTVRHAEAGLRWMFGADEPGAREFFQRFGLANNKVLVRGLARIGRVIAEDTAVAPRSMTRIEQKEHKDVLFAKSIADAAHRE